MSAMRVAALALLAIATSACTGGPAVPGWNELIVYPLINALVLLYDIFFRDFGIAIVVLTVVLRAALYPLFLAQLRSQRVQQELAPAIAEIRKKYKNDRQRFAEEQMKLYRERGFNPMAGCLPLLLQMPILFGLYSALSQVGCGLGQFAVQSCQGIKGEELATILYPLVPNPIQAGETLRTTSIFLPWSELGLADIDPFRILPVLAGLVTFVSSAMTMPKKQPQTDDPMQRSMQMMIWYTPILTVVFGWGLPAGLSLYWIVTTLFSILQQWLTSGWGKLGAWLPALERVAPSPSSNLMRHEQQEAIKELERDLSTAQRSEEPVAERGERRRRRRRR
jgi:YidC/Oxa1 family membrane protein insertase